MDDPTGERDRRTITPAIVISSVFVAACAVFAISFVSARGGLQMPIAASQPPAAVVSQAPTEAPQPSVAPATATPTPAASPAPPSIGPSLPPSVAPTPTPSLRPTAQPFALPTLKPGDPLLALPGCAGYPACYAYTVAHGDTLSGIISRYRLDIDILQALNPGQLSDPSLIRTGQLLYLGRSPFARLALCRGGAACVVYVVQPGDTLSLIAARYLLSTEAILDANPGLPRPIQPGQEIKLPA
ncbi:MAG TPA: LysM peptidoglycan-binding domain-containing protein [Candidatus Limnocylindrales bacterium]|nr:LysM peptidoglycan-binding domain-containing protein [Candidatus Limnocylindrales bacterium]